METIEERALAYKQKIQDEASLEGVEILAPNAYYSGYKQGATEQRAIDFEIAKEHLCADCNRRCVCFGNKESQKNCGKLRSLMTDFVFRPWTVGKF